MQRTKAVALSMVAGAGAAISTASVAAAEGPWHGDRYDSHNWAAAFLMFLLLAAGVVLLVVLLTRPRHPAPATPPSGAPAPPASPTLNAQAILADRLARGEISPDDYRAAIAVLREPPPA